MKLRWSDRARRDLLRIGRYIARDDPAAARLWVERLRNKAQMASRNPNMGRIVPEYSRPDLREVVQGRYRIVYKVSEEACTILTVFEGHRLIPEDLLSVNEPR